MSSLTNTFTLTQEQRDALRGGGGGKKSRKRNKAARAAARAATQYANRNRNLIAAVLNGDAENVRLIIQSLEDFCINFLIPVNSLKTYSLQSPSGGTYYIRS